MQVSLKKLVVVNFCILLVLSMGMYAFAATPTSTFWISSGIYPRSEYTIWKEGDNCFAKDKNGQLDFDGTNASDVIGNALNALTVGRPSKETVTIIGLYTITATIKIPSYTHLDLTEAKFVVSPSGSTFQVFENEDTVSGNSHISIEGGIIDGNRGETRGTSGDGIFFNQVQDFWIKDVTIYNARTDGIAFLGCIYGTVTNTKITNAGYRGIYIHSSFQIECSDITIVLTDGDGVGVTQSSSNIEFTNLISSNSTYSGMAVDWGSNNVHVTNGVFKYCDYGIEINGTSYSSFTNIVVQDNNNSGIGIYRIGTTPTNNIFDNVIAINNGRNVSGDARYGIWLNGANNTILTNVIADATVGSTQQWGIYETNDWGNSMYNIISVTKAWGNAVGGIHIDTDAGNSTSRVVNSYNGTFWISTWGTG